MDTKYNTKLPNKLTAEYLDFLINKVFSLLPMFEDSLNSEGQRESFIIFQKTLIQTINGNSELIYYNHCVVVDILSHLEALFNITKHDEYKRHIFKICHLLSILKEEVIRNGL